MPYETTLFHVTRPWSELAKLGELDAVLTGSGNGDDAPRNVFLHHASLLIAGKINRLLKQPSLIIDFGCGTGRFVRYFGRLGHTVIGTDICPEMLEQARKFGVPKGSKLVLTNGLDLPVPDNSIDLIFVYGVLRLSLNVPNPAHDRIAREMYRVLKPGGRVANLEVYVDQPASDFTRDFEAAGFKAEKIRLIGRYLGRLEKLAYTLRLSKKGFALTGWLSAFFYYHFSSLNSTKGGIRDYLFVWKKP